MIMKTITHSKPHKCCELCMWTNDIEMKIKTLSYNQIISYNQIWPPCVLFVAIVYADSFDPIGFICVSIWKKKKQRDPVFYLIMWMNLFFLLVDNATKSLWYARINAGECLIRALHIISTQFACTIFKLFCCHCCPIFHWLFFSRYFPSFDEKFDDFFSSIVDACYSHSWLRFYFNQK